MANDPIIEAFFDEATNTVSYLLVDPQSGEAAVIDPVLDFDMASGTVDVRSAVRILERANDKGWHIVAVLETHAHADHLSAAPFIKVRTGCWVGIGEHIRDVQKIFRPIFAFDDLVPDGAEFDRLFADGETFMIGNLPVEVLHVPGHTPADIAYRVGDALFVGDTLFMPDYGTARADFPGGNARTLYRSIRRVLSLPGTTRLFMCHDYKAPGREDYRWETTVDEQRRTSVHVHDGVSEAAFVAMREARDATLPVPKLLLPSIQVNIRAGHFPKPQGNGVRYLRIPVKDPADALAEA
ncbi:MBL fold metallo-hydrolase [Sphingobium sp.]|uniref:MBL fold metallo-hydrolase n=1 Tax=Sphingobium sp. TaxID=1912891 RepID=UPI002E1D019B